jgi:hypothetical protein
MRKPLRCYLWNSLLTAAAFIPPFAMDQSIARRTLQELIKREDLKNKSCVDCGNPNPQWASLRFARFIPSTRHFPKTALTASPYLSAYNARGFTEVSACTSGELIYVTVSGFLNECNPCIVLSAPYRWTLGKRSKFGEWRYGTPIRPVLLSNSRQDRRKCPLCRIYAVIYPGRARRLQGGHACPR